ncbi:MAG: 16S rRNA (cytidine(1402)-2'-O)-methyltransferase [Desulfomonile sp.]
MQKSRHLGQVGVLFVVATPIGNLEDITLRAIETLRSVDLIASEDTRKSRILLQRWNISKSLVSLHRFTERSKTYLLLERIQKGQNIALISDAGTPAISDPGHRLVRAALEAGIRVVPIPGPSSIMAALSVSGTDCSSFVYLGFVPKQEGSRRIFFERLTTEERTSVFFESPKRIVGTLKEMAVILGPRPLVLVRELTKIHEEVLSGTASEILQTLQERDSVRGEITVVVRGSSQPKSDIQIETAVKTLLEEGYTGKRLADEACKRSGVKKRAAYDKFLEIKRDNKG